MDSKNEKPVDETAAAEATAGPVEEPKTAVAEVAPTAAEKRDAKLTEVRRGTSAAAAAVEQLATVGESPMVPFNPQDFNSAWKLAGFLSESGVVPDDLKGNAGAVLSVMARGVQLGLHWSVAVQSAYVVYGRVGWPAAIIAALVDTSPAFEYFEVLEADNEHCVVEAKKHRWEEPRRHEVTLEDAKTAGFLDGKHSEQWKLRPYYMLIAMARREAGRMWDPARLAGVYDVEELHMMGREQTRQLPKRVSTTALEGFGSSGGSLPPAEVAAAEEHPAEAARPATKPGPDTCALSSSQVERITSVLSQHPAVDTGALSEKLGCDLSKLRGNLGETPEALYTRVLEVVRDLKKSAAR